VASRDRAIYYYIDAIQNTRYMDAAELSLFCGVILAVLVVFVSFVGVCVWISSRLKVHVLIIIMSVCLPSVWLGSLIAAIICT